MIDKLEMFIALANERHFGRAAEACGVTQPSLSSAIRQLEDQLGVQLVFRGSRFQGLTPEGQRVLDWGRRIVGDMRALKDEMRTVRSGLSGNIRIGVIPTALPMVVGLTLEEITADMGAFWHNFTVGDSQLRWLGPEKGVIHLATAALVNALWDLKGKIEGKPVWRLLTDMTPAETVALVDWRYLSDALDPGRARAP